MEASETTENPGFLEYIHQLNEGRNHSEALAQSLKQINGLDLAQLKRIGLKTYAEGKWTIPQLLQHLIDWERIWCFRAILFARKEGTIPDGHDQEIMVVNSNADARSIDELIHELRILRQSTILMFESFNKEMLETTCRFFEYEMPLNAIAFAITAHQIHHFKVIEERYLPQDE
jgi:uncharacterized damage-inducible protein DinB